MGGIIGVKNSGRQVSNMNKSGEGQTSCWNPVYYPTVRVRRLAGNEVW